MNMYDPKNMVRGHKRYYSHDTEQGLGCLHPESKPIIQKNSPIRKSRIINLSPVKDKDRVEKKVQRLREDA